MKKLLIKFIFFFLILFFTLILFLEENLELEYKDICKINMNDLNKYVKVKGSIKNIKNYKNITFITLTNNECKIYNVLFQNLDNLNNLYKLNKNNKKKEKELTIIGKVTLYKGNFEIIISEIY